MFALPHHHKEYHAPDNIDEIKQDSSYHHSVLEKLNKRDRQGHYRPARTLSELLRGQIETGHQGEVSVQPPISA